MNSRTKHITTALGRAQKLWGPQACVDYRPFALTAAKKAAYRASLNGAKPPRGELWKLYTDRCNVGRVELCSFFAILGSGDTWAAAFKQARERAKR